MSEDDRDENEKNWSPANEKHLLGDGVVIETPPVTSTIRHSNDDDVIGAE